MSKPTNMLQTLDSTSTNFPSLFHITNSGQTLPMPFAREIFLFTCYIAGTNFRPNLPEIEPTLKIGEKLRLQREPKNEFDELAIAVYDTDTNHLGYLPKTINEIPARLLDAGKTLSAKLVGKEWSGTWLKLDIEIFLND